MASLRRIIKEKEKAIEDLRLRLSKYKNVTVVWSADGIISEGEYAGSLAVGDGLLTIYWRVDGEYLLMGLKGKTEGWVAIGFEPSTRMKDADIIFGWVYPNGTPVVLDLYSTGETGPHPPDSELGGRDDIVRYGGSEGGGYTVIEFKRKLNTGDDYDKVLEVGTDVHIIWAVGSSDSLNVKHFDKGSATLRLEGVGS